MNILDSSVLILFLREIRGRKYLELLDTNGEKFIIPNSVYGEVLDDETKIELDDMLLSGIFEKVYNGEPNDKEMIRRRFPSLGNGEINVLSLAKKFVDDGVETFYCVIDETPGRNAAKNLGLPLTGSIGLIDILKRDGLIDDNHLQKLIGDIKDSPFHVSDDIFEELKNG